MSRSSASFTYRAKATGIAVTSPLAIRVKVRDGKIILFPIYGRQLRDSLRIPSERQMDCED